MSLPLLSLLFTRTTHLQRNLTEFALRQMNDEKCEELDLSNGRLDSNCAERIADKLKASIEAQLSLISTHYYLLSFCSACGVTGVAVTVFSLLHLHVD